MHICITLLSVEVDYNPVTGKLYFFCIFIFILIKRTCLSPI